MVIASKKYSLQNLIHRSNLHNLRFRKLKKFNNVTPKESLEFKIQTFDFDLKGEFIFDACVFLRKTNYNLEEVLARVNDYIFV